MHSERIFDDRLTPVTEAELIFGIGRLDPEHSATAGNVEKISEVIDKRPSHRTVSPDQSIWRAITAILIAYRATRARIDNACCMMPSSSVLLAT
jgi:hypothetical protein